MPTKPYGVGTARVAKFIKNVCAAASGRREIIMNIPRDLVIYRRNQILKRVIPCAVLLIFLSVALFLWGDTIFQIENRGVRVFCYIVVLVLPFIITGVPLKMIDSTYCGTVKKVNVVTTMDNESTIKPTLEGIYYKNTVYLTIETAEGKIIRRKARSQRADSRQPLDIYCEGDIVFHLYGTKHVVVIPTGDSPSIDCVVCGAANEAQNVVCKDCRHTLLR